MAEILHDDLQQELAAAKFHLSLVRNGVKSDPSLRQITAQIDRMLKDAVEKSRNLSHELSPAVLHLDDFAQTLRWLADEVQAKHGLAVRVQGHMPMESEGLKAFLYRAVQGLLFNVVKHARVKEARIRVRRLEQYLCLTVSDRGRGFDPQGLQEVAGFGLLSIRERVELLGGRMRIKSAGGQGSTFFIVVPEGETVGTGSAAGERGGGRAKSAERSASGTNGRVRVLLVDDHEIVRQGLVSLLSEEESIEIVGEASNGREAVNLADQLKPDVVIMDVSMPLMDGYEATRQIKANLPQMRVVALSMYNEPEAMENMQRAGAEGYVLKTAPFDELLAAIRGESQTPSAVPA
jgi:CheY-like chemotaxis protein